jgi:immune inhibitor A
VKRPLVLILMTLLTLGAWAGNAEAVKIGRGTAARADGGNGHVKQLPKFVRNWMSAKARAADLVARGEARVDRRGRVAMGNGTFVDYALQGTDHIVTLLVEFADGNGPLHNQVPEPDRTLDNTTYWRADFDRQHYEDLMTAPGGGSAGITSVRDFYLEQSSGRYTVDSQVSDWLQVPYPESEYGGNSNGPGSDDKHGQVYELIRDTLDAMNPASAGIDWSPSTVDVWDRYDCDGDGNFDEPDGYVDHFQIVHAGIGEEDGGGAQGGAAIWSHRWYANAGGAGVEGPTGCLLGGYPTHVNGLWVGDYTMEPENGGVGVFAHEFGHDLGLPDLYDTVGANDNSISFWSIMSDGSNVSDDPESIGTKPTHMGPWEKLVLGWLGDDLVTVEAGSKRTLNLGPAEGASTSGAQAVRIDLPDYERRVKVFPPTGPDRAYYYSGQGDDLDNAMTRPLEAPLAEDTTLSFVANFQIEKGWDYAYVRSSSDGGATWTELDGNLSTDDDPNGQNFGHGITGKSNGWVKGRYVVPAGATDIGFGYWSDGAVAKTGFAVDAIKLGSEPVDQATDPSAWTFDGFSRLKKGGYDQEVFHYFLVESRSYVRSDTALCGAYLFVTDTWVDKQCYANGVLVWYRNSGFNDNNVSEHPGSGQILVVDSHPAPSPAVVGPGNIRERWQTWDSSFGFEQHAVTLHAYNKNDVLRARTYVAKPVTVFFDGGPRAYWDPENPYASVKTPGSGVRVTLLQALADGMTYRIRIS